MKCSELWLREWVNPSITREELCRDLTMGGFEVEELAPVADFFKDVVIGQIMAINKHPEADRLNICEVNIGEEKPLSIVCGANNVRIGLKVPVAKIGALLPHNKEIQPTTIRGIPSQGMLCSASELSLNEGSEGLFELAHDAPLGTDVRNYLNLDDYTIEVAITPNRGDCLSVRGLARETSAITQSPLLKNNIITEVVAQIEDKCPLTVEAKIGCPHYIGRIIRNIKVDLATPVWMSERLRRSGIRSINPIVDVTNYVMLELGQPMHAFDFNTIQKGIIVRLSNKGEKITLLDGSEKELDAETLVIADHEKPLAIAGVMGGLDSSVTLTTTDILLESAYFSPAVIARQRQFYGLNSDSAYRFERGVDPTMQQEAMDRATQLILDLVGGKAGPLIEKTIKELLPKEPTIVLSPTKITQVVGFTIPNEEVEAIFKALKFNAQWHADHWDVQVPRYRFDLTLAEDLIEEIVRIMGYDKIPTHALKSVLQAAPTKDKGEELANIRQCLSDHGYHEIISYSFVDKRLQSLLDPEVVPQELVNPITAEMTVMRTNLWPGLINTMLYNKSRQQNRIRLFELGTCFITDSVLQQPLHLAGLITGPVYPEQWGISTKEADFFDLKGDINNILTSLKLEHSFLFSKDTHPALHPGQTAGIYYQGKKIGLLGALHPTVLQKLDLSQKVFVFEVDLAFLAHPTTKVIQEVSKFPEVRRDLALLVNDTIPATEIQDTIKRTAGDWLKDVFIFDVYQGKGISPGQKSVALALVIQHPTRTLIDTEVAELMERVITALKGQLGAELRS